ncbi:MAG: hypothetical protein KUG77_16875 [Nannocystaceae bacterium]|nr:hypothetical protein [Nannocystaceae bacterium]
MFRPSLQMTAPRLLALSCAALLGACGSSSDGADTDGEAGTDGAETTTVGDGPSTTGSPGTNAVATSVETDEGDASNTTEPNGPTSGSDSTDPTVSTDSETGDDPGAPQIPDVQGECPEFVLAQGDNPANLAFPVGAGSRNALVWHDPNQGGGGPLVFYFHGSGGDPDDATATVTDDAIAAVLESGGTVIAPFPDPTAGTEWFLVSGGAQNDMVMMDSMVACAVQDAGVDPYRIHGVGFSAGALHVGISSILRSSYVASTVLYSGGVYSTAASETAATPSSLIFHGGASDVVSGLSFSGAAQRYYDVITERGGEAVICDHGTGHGYPDNEVDVWRRRDAYNFLIDHPFGVTPAPYAGGLPQWLPPYCSG